MPGELDAHLLIVFLGRLAVKVAGPLFLARGPVFAVRVLHDEFSPP